MPSEIDLKARINAALLERETISHDAYGAKKAAGLLRQRDELLRAALASLPDRTGEPVAWPTDAELLALNDECRKMPGGFGMLYSNYAREVLRRYASPPDAEQARLRERVAELEAERDRYKRQADGYYGEAQKGWTKFRELERMIAAEARLADLQRAPQGVTGKPLEWVEAHRAHPLDGPEVIRSWRGMAVGMAWATAVECNDGKTTLLSEPTCSRFDTLDAAKAAAQADYEARILSALASSTQGKREPAVTDVMVEAALSSWFREMPPISVVEAMGGYQGTSIEELRTDMRAALEVALRTSSTGGKG